MRSNKQIYTNVYQISLSQYYQYQNFRNIVYFLNKKNFVQNFFAFVKRSFKIIVKNVFDKNNNFLKKILNVDLF